MKQYFLSVIFLYLFLCGASAREIKNVIFMVPDGTSLSTLSLVRWYQSYTDPGRTLAIAPYICGMVTNHSSNAPIGDSAPAMGSYMTGYYSRPGYISMYPPESENDIVSVDPSRSYSPNMTVMEAARIARNKAVGLVFTCEFLHATPAATSAHWYKRSDYGTIQQQMVHNSIDVLIGGGTGFLTPEHETFLVKKGYEVYRNDIDKFRNSASKKLWALFGDSAMDNDWDRDTTKQPSLAEMTKKAITLLSKNREGFFLMVEGSKVDWSSHNNDPVGIISELSAFDAAVKAAIEFAKADGETLVVICPDHGTGGVSIGNRLSDGNYSGLTLRDMMEPFKKCKKTAEYVTGRLINLSKERKDSISIIMKDLWDISLDETEIEMIAKAKESAVWSDIRNLILKSLQSRTHIGFTTHGHTGEDLFLAIYHPQNRQLTGLVAAHELNRYLCNAVGIESLDDLSDKYYRNANILFKEKDFIIKPSAQTLKITPRNNKKTTMVITANTNQVSVNNQIFETKTPAVYVDKNDTWYVSEECLLFIK